MGSSFAWLLDPAGLEFGLFEVDPTGAVAPGASSSAHRFLGPLVHEGAAWSMQPTPAEPDFVEVEGRPLRLQVVGVSEQGGAIWMVQDVTELVEIRRRAEISELRVHLLRQWDAFSSFVEDGLRSIELAKDSEVEQARALVSRIAATARAFELHAVAEVAGELEAASTVDPDALDELAATIWNFLDEHAEILAIDLQRFDSVCSTDAPAETIWAERARLRPIRQLLGPVEAVVERVAESCGRRVELRVEGDDLAVDPRLLQPILRGLGPLLENALMHGIEPPGERGDKPELGEVLVSFREDEDHWMVAVEDDGRGIDTGLLVERARERGLFDDSTLDAMPASSRMALAFIDGIGSRTGETACLAAVKDALDDVCASLEIRSAPGRGTRVCARVPKPIGATLRGATGDIVSEMMTGRAFATTP